MSGKLTVKKIGEVVESEISRLGKGEESYHNLATISKALNVIVRANADAIYYAEARGEKPSIPFYEEK